MPSVVAKADILSLRLELFCLGNFEVSAFNASFAVGQIPSASCALAIGRNAFNPAIAATIHDQGGNLTQMHRAKVWLRMRGAYSLNRDWPTAETLIFDGYLTGVGHRKAMGQVQFVANLIHWTADLAFSSSLSEQSHPANPSDYTYRAVFKSRKAGVNRPQGIGQLAATDVITSANIGSDLWGDAIKPFFCGLAQEDTIKTIGDATDIGIANRKNTLALAALKRFEGGTGTCGRRASRYHVKLAMDLQGSTVVEAAAKAIAQSITRDSIESYSSTTLWDVLVGQLGPRFMFTTVPTVDSALVVPLMPGLRGTYSQQIALSDYEFVELSGFIPRPVRGVGIFGSKDMVAGTRDPGGPANVVSRLGIGGYYEPKSATNRGMVLFRRAPAWLANIPVSNSSPARTMGLRGKHAISSATTPLAAKNEEIVGDAQGKTQGQRASESAKLYNAYAKALYVIEALRGRNGMLAGKLRFDIGPGSNVAIEGGSEQFIGSDALGQNLVGTVMRVSIGINAEVGRAGTGFQLGHIRTAYENTQDATSIEQHPLYTTKFLGAPLVPSYVL